MNKKSLQRKSGAFRHLLVTRFIFSILLTGLVLTGCGQDSLIVGQWEMTKVLVGEQEYDAEAFLDPQNEADSSFIIQFYSDKTLIATGSLGTVKGASDGIWEKTSENEFSFTIDGVDREASMTGNLLFMESETENAMIVIVFEKNTD